MKNLNSYYPSAASVLSPESNKPVKKFNGNFGFSESMSSKDIFEGGSNIDDKPPVYFKGQVNYNLNKYEK